MSRHRGCKVIAGARLWLALEEANPLLFVATALVPAALAFPLRLLVFGDGSPFTQIVLGPLLEESTKLAGTMVVLLAAALLLPRGRDHATVLGYWLFLAPWLVGGIYGLSEGVLVYPGEGAPSVTLREAAHATFTALSLLGTLLIWRSLDAGATGVTLGVLFGFGAHVGFNLLAAVAVVADLTFLEQTGYVAVLAAVAVVGLNRVVRQATSLPEARSFLVPSWRG